MYGLWLFCLISSVVTSSLILSELCLFHWEFYFQIPQTYLDRHKLSYVFCIFKWFILLKIVYAGFSQYFWAHIRKHTLEKSHGALPRKYDTKLYWNWMNIQSQVTYSVWNMGLFSWTLSSWQELTKETHLSGGTLVFHHTMIGKDWFMQSLWILW